MIENAQAGTTERFNHVHMYHEHPACAMQWYVVHLGARMPQSRGGAAPPVATGECRTTNVRAANLAVICEDWLRP